MSNLSVHPENPESLGDGFVREGLLEAQRLSWMGLKKILESIKPGVSEKEAATLADQILRSLGSSRNWHRTIVRFAENTVLPYWEKGDPKRILKTGEIFFIDIGPNWVLPAFGNLEYEGDVGHSFTSGLPTAEKTACIELGRKLFVEASKEWHHGKLSGHELYQWLTRRASDEGYQLVLDDDGHRISDFPHKRFCVKGLNQVSFIPASHLWVLEIHVVDQKNKIGAFLEDVLHENPTLPTFNPT